MSAPQKGNHLAQETSPYLQQHAHNPVEWYPWCEEALEKARLANKPILLSIGYAACHWCHVMAHESFEDEATAELMNQLFVNIKVDREERPDLDKIYQTAHYVLSQRSGGWPLTVFLTSDDLTPFFSGTYFPREARYQLPAFKDVLRSLANVYQNQFDTIKQQNGELLKILHRRNTLDSSIHLDNQPIPLALQSLQRNYDQIHGGFGSAPKFPQAPVLEFLLQTKTTMALATLQHMAAGGIYDQLEGGFYRYSVDAKWQIPHFEKMLYDNAQLLYLYSLAAKQQENMRFEEIARETAEWIIIRMQSLESGYYSSLDADSEGHEGKYYVWEKSEIESLLSKDEFALIRLHFGLDNAPNFEKKWHLTISLSLDLVASQLKITLLKAKKLLSSAKEKLRVARNKRVSPGCDKKILTSWNSLMIKGMLTAGTIFQEERYIQSAQHAIDFIQQKLFVNKRLLVSYKDGKAHLAAYLDDYAFLLDALITSLRISWNKKYLLFAIALADALLEYFSDEELGGFYFTAVDHEKLLYRPKSFTDDAIPSGNAIAIRALLTLGYLLGESRYLTAAEKTLQAAWPELMKFPSAHCGLLLGLKYFLEPPPTIVVIRGAENEIQSWRNECDPVNNFVFAIPDDEKELPGGLALKESQGKTCAYVCRGTQCLAVIESLEKLKEGLA